MLSPAVAWSAGEGMPASRGKTSHIAESCKLENNTNIILYNDIYIRLTGFIRRHIE
jgi:hypothetical protein